MIIHFTTVHPRTDTRIRVKEVASLAASLDCPIELFVQDGLGDEWVDEPGFWIRDTGERPKGRLARMSAGAWRMFQAVRRAKPKVAHFHDPELLPWALLLRLSGIRVIYDVHEDLPRQTLSKHYLPKWLRRPLAGALHLTERLGEGLLSGIVTATPAIGAKFSSSQHITAQNFALPSELISSSPSDYATRPEYIAYVGGLSAIRGAAKIIEAIKHVDKPSAKLVIAGNFSPASLKETIETEVGMERVALGGFLNRQQVRDMLDQARAGIVTFLPLPNHTSAQPNKMFEYMAAGLPVIASDFPLWREIIDGAQCGLLVDPRDPQAIAAAMQWIIDHPEEAKEMGKRGRQAVEERYNWDHEATKLVDFYHTKLGVPLKANKQSDQI